MEGVFLPELGNVGLEGSRNVCSDEQVSSAEVGICAELLLDTRKGGVRPQAGCDSSTVFNRTQAKVAEALLDHKVVCLPNLFAEGTQEKPGIREARFGEFGIGANCVAVFLGLGGLEVGGDCGALGGVIGRHFFW